MTGALIAAGVILALLATVVWRQWRAQQEALHWRATHERPERGVYDGDRTEDWFR